MNENALVFLSNPSLHLKVSFWAWFFPAERAILIHVLCISSLCERILQKIVVFCFQSLFCRRAQTRQTKQSCRIFKPSFLGIQILRNVNPAVLVPVLQDCPLLICDWEGWRSVLYNRTKQTTLRQTDVSDLYIVYKMVNGGFLSRLPLYSRTFTMLSHLNILRSSFLTAVLPKTEVPKYTCLDEVRGTYLTLLPPSTGCIDPHIPMYIRWPHIPVSHNTPVILHSPEIQQPIIKLSTSPVVATFLGVSRALIGTCSSDGGWVYLIGFVSMWLTSVALCPWLMHWC